VDAARQLGHLRLPDVTMLEYSLREQFNGLNRGAPASAPRCRMWSRRSRAYGAGAAATVAAAVLSADAGDAAPVIAA
jgi:hypothetical protein